MKLSPANIPDSPVWSGDRGVAGCLRTLGVGTCPSPPTGTVAPPDLPCRHRRHLPAPPAALRLHRFLHRRSSRRRCRLLRCQFW
ncbi:hypothetical protein DPMN_136860 [Dreissena polymorpha]|uniref:Uncharacterized protein n=1 Tax=Dreissena polymorpha TaxID=45954 RepID=A0A9D4JFX8_DREPO|nr:hypothetical protein DPMN_136860 [Dreissena polymorpha]